MKKIVWCFTWLLLLAAFSTYAIGAIGHIDGTGEIGQGRLGVAGWSCLPGQSTPIEVALYAGEQYLTRTRANLQREAAVGVACGVNSTSQFGFILELTAEQRQQFSNLPIYVYGMVNGSVNIDQSLSNSGVFFISAPADNLHLLPSQTIVLHPYSPGGNDGDSMVFTQRLVDTFGNASTWQARYLGFALLLNPLQEQDHILASRIKQAFAAAQKHQMRLLIHINHEWMFGFFPEHDIDYGNLMIEQLTGVRALGFNSYQRVNESSEILESIEWSSWDRPLDQFSLYWGSESIQPPRLNFMSSRVRHLLAAKAQIIKAAIQESFATYFDVNSHLFLGIDIGWETSVDDQDSSVPIGFGALQSLGHRAAAPPADINNELRNVAINFVDFGGSLYQPLVGPQKLFSHYLLLDQDVPFPDYNYPRWIRNPANHAWLQQMVPGFSLYCTSSDCGEVQWELGQAVEQNWAITEINPETFPAVIYGFPDQNVAPPLFVTLYSFGANVVKDPQVLNNIRWFLANP